VSEIFDAESPFEMELSPVVINLPGRSVYKSVESVGVEMRCKYIAIASS